MANNGLVVPLVLWGHNPPTHKISSVFITPNFQTLVTGCHDGQLCIWNCNHEGITANSMLFGHTGPVTSITAIPALASITSNKKTFWKKQHIISASELGEVYLWDLADGHCLEQTKLPGCPVELIGCNIALYNEPQPCIMCYGQFSEILILNASTLTPLLSLVSRIYPDWIACASLTSCDQSSISTSVIGLTVKGVFKVWRIPTPCSQRILFEDESKQVNYSRATALKASKTNPELFLIVCSKNWYICDGSDYSTLCSLPAPHGHEWVGGDFASLDMVMVWNRIGEISIFKIPFSASDQECYRCNLKNKSLYLPSLVRKVSMVKQQQFLSPPVVKVYHNLRDNSLYLTIGTCDGVVGVMELNERKHNTIHKSSLNDLWNSLPAKPSGIIDLLGLDRKSVYVTSTLFVVQYCLLFCGCDNGSIIVVSAAKSCIKQLLYIDCGNNISWPPRRILHGHTGKVTCLLYPFQEEPHRYSQTLLISGSADFSVSLWDIELGTLLHAFHIHGGEIEQLIIPPNGCSQRVSQSICSVGNDHSVGLVHVLDRKCILFASRHPSPIVSIRWRTEDDFLMVVCADTTLFVWQMETGNLERCEKGAIAGDILTACDEMEAIRTDIIAPNSVNVSQALKNRSFNALKSVAQQGLKSLIESLDVDKNSTRESKLRSHNMHQPMIVSPLRTNVQDGDSHVVFFNTESLIAKLLVEHSQEKKHNQHFKKQDELLNSSDSKKTLFTNFIEHVKQQFLDDTNDSLAPKRQGHARKKKKRVPSLEIDSAMDMAQIIVSCLHAWGLDPDIDEICNKRLGMLTPKAPVSFGLLSRYGHMALLLPKPPVEDTAINMIKANQAHWQISNSLTTRHLLSIIAVANTMMELPYACFHSSETEAFQKNVVDSADILRNQLNPAEQSQVKQGWSLLATLHCVLLPEHMEMLKYKPPKLELLARRWQDRCLELRGASQALMLAELRQMGFEGRRKVIESWSRHLPDFVKQPAKDSELLDSPDSYMVSDEIGDRSSVNSDELISQPNAVFAADLSYEARRRHATAIVILGVIGAEFGHELTPQKTRRSIPDICESIAIANSSLARYTCKALMNLLLQPPSNSLPANLAIRRAAMDLLGRGFIVWEPFMEISAVLLGLLESCENYYEHTTSIQSGLSLTPEADLCRTAHHSLYLIATSRPSTFVKAIARAITKYNIAATHQQLQSVPSTSVLVRSKPEILRIIEHLVDKMISEVSDLLVEVVDIALFCVDMTILRMPNGLLEAVPSLAKFRTVSYDVRSRRVAIAAGDGTIVLHDVRTCKRQIVPRSHGKISALCFSPDGKYLSVYCESRNTLSFWITATSLFGMVQSQVKCVKTLNLRDAQPKIQAKKISRFPCESKNFTKLRWVNNRAVSLSSDGIAVTFQV